MDWTWYLFGFNGRINRAKMWLAILIIVCWMMFLGMLAVVTSSVLDGPTSFRFNINDLFRVIDPASYRSLSWADIPSILIKAIGTPLFAWVYLATSIKRLHDRDKSGWWMVPFFAAPGVYDNLADRFEFSHAAMPLGLAAFGLCIWGFVEIYLLKGSRKTNRFGPNPLQPIDTRPRWDQSREIEMVPHKAGPPLV